MSYPDLQFWRQFRDDVREGEEDDAEEATAAPALSQMHGGAQGGRVVVVSIEIPKYSRSRNSKF